jgi:hypothetical protein
VKTHPHLAAPSLNKKLVREFLGDSWQE